MQGAKLEPPGAVAAIVHKYVVATVCHCCVFADNETMTKHRDIVFGTGVLAPAIGGATGNPSM